MTADAPGSTTAPPETVLIIEDDAAVRSLLTEYVGDLGLVAAQAEDGVTGLARARDTAPDIILLDVHLPDMDGRQVLALLKRDAGLRSLPVIVISGLGEGDLAARCIEAGAEDYLSKPVNPTLLLARLRSSLERRRMRAQEIVYQRRIEAHAQQLEEQVRVKTRNLAEAHERLRTLDRAKDAFLSLIAHELRTPATGVLGASEALANENLDQAARRTAANLLGLSVGRLLRIAEDALLLTTINASLEVSSLAAHPLTLIWATACEHVSAVADGGGVRIDPLPDCGAVTSDPTLLGRALGALLECAVKFSIPGETVRVTCSKVRGALQLRLEAKGHRIPPDQVPKFFEVLSLDRPITPGGDLGLAPAVAGRILQVLGQSVSVMGTEHGTAFIASVGCAVDEAQPPEPNQSDG